MSKRKASDSAASRRSAGLWWVGLPCGVVLMVSPGTLILVAALLMPAALLALLMRQGGARTVQAALLFGLAACVHPVHLLWLGDTEPANALALLRQPLILPTGWIAVLAGWLVSELATALSRLYADLVAARQRRQMMEQIALIEAEWGPMPASAPLPPI